jgi:hypothetical protein
MLREAVTCSVRSCAGLLCTARLSLEKIVALNPIASPTSNGAVGDLGLSVQTQKDAADVAELARKKKLQQMQDQQKAGGAGVPNAAFQTLTTGMI